MNKKTTIYAIMATGAAGGINSAQVLVAVNITLPNMEIPSDKYVIEFRKSATLSWILENVEFCKIDQNQGAVDKEGSLPVSPSETTTYTIKATGPGGLASGSVTIYM